MTTTQMTPNDLFQPKGADRKQKTDREKMEKRAPQEKEKYQPSYETTILTEVSISLMCCEMKRRVFKNETHPYSIQKVKEMKNIVLFPKLSPERTQPIL